MDKADMDKRSTLFLFRIVTRTKSREVLRSSGAISCGRLRELFKIKLEELGYPVVNYGLHSLWAGGDTAAANAGVRVLEVRKCEGWICGQFHGVLFVCV